MPVALVAGVCVVIAGGAVAVALSLGSSSSSPLAGDSPAQVLATSLSAARDAGSAHVSWTLTGQDGHDSMALDMGPQGAELNVSPSGAAGVRYIVTSQHVYILASADVLKAMDLPPSDESFSGHWLELPASESGLSQLIGITKTDGFISDLLDLVGTITRTSPAGAKGSVIYLHGRVPNDSFTSSNGAGDLATLEISADAPYYPLQLSFSDATNGSQTYLFSSWGEHVTASAPAGAIVLPSTVPTGVGSAADTAAQADLETALTGARVYYTQQNQTFSGLDPATFGAIDTGLTAVGGTTPSTAYNVVSLYSSADYVVFAAWAAESGHCWAIVDNAGTSSIEGETGSSVTYVESPAAPETACTAATYAVPGKVPGSKTSQTGFSALG
jgi:hypothetical protein